MSKPNKREYTGVRKLNYDELWHAMFNHREGLLVKEGYDRVSKSEALAILRRMERGKKI